jgi:hypothetical protein
MQLVVVSDTGAAIMAVEDLDPCLEHGSLSVRLDKVAGLLEGIRQAAIAATPEDSTLRETHPERLALIAQGIVSVAASARALAESAASDDPNAAAVLETLSSLGL